MSTQEELVHYCVVRLVPDVVRQEVANVAVVVAGSDGVHVRSLEGANAHVRAIAPPSLWGLLPDFKATLEDYLRPGSAVASLHQLHLDGLTGFEVTEPRRLLIDRRFENADAAADRLFDEYVRPRRWRSRSNHRPRIETTVRNAFRLSPELHPQRLALGLVVHGRFADYRFPAAFANGKTTIVQAVDFDVTKASQEEQTRATIARVVETDRLLTEVKPSWLTLFKSGPGSAQYAGRLSAFSETLPISELKNLVHKVIRDADTPVETAFVRAGLEVRRYDEEVVVGTSA